MNFQVWVKSGLRWSYRGVYFASHSLTAARLARRSTGCKRVRVSPDGSCESVTYKFA
jgi:hypothetical protein